MFPPKSPSPTPPIAGDSKTAVDYLSGGDSGSPVHGKVAALVNEFGVDAVRQALDACECGDGSDALGGESFED